MVFLYYFPIRYQTALMWAAAQGHLHVVEGLVANEAKLDTVTKSGKTALMLACRFGHYEVVEYLAAKMEK